MLNNTFKNYQSTRASMLSLLLLTTLSFSTLAKDIHNISLCVCLLVVSYFVEHLGLVVDPTVSSSSAYLLHGSSIHPSGGYAMCNVQAVGFKKLFQSHEPLGGQTVGSKTPFACLVGW